MSWFNDPFITNLNYRLGWALIHSLWLGLLIAAMLKAALVLLPERLPGTRYLCSCAALMVLLASISVIAWRSAPPDSVESQYAVETHDTNVAETVVPPIVQRSDGAARLPAAPDTAMPRSGSLASKPLPVSEPPPVKWWATSGLQQASEAVHQYSLWGVLAWLIGVAYLALWHMGGWVRAHRLRKVGTAAPPEHLSRLFDQLVRQMEVSRTVVLRVSNRIGSPMVIGWIKPVVLFPAGLIGGMTATQLEALIVHEMAHIRRHDYLINLLQTVTETLLFYHPAVWWMSCEIRKEREYCCDAAVIHETNHKTDYAHALLVLTQSRPRRTPFAVAADGGPLVERIRRLVGLRRIGPHRPRLAGVCLALLVIAAPAVIVACRAGSGAGTDAETFSTELESDATLGPIVDYRAVINAESGSSNTILYLEPEVDIKRVPADDWGIGFDAEDRANAGRIRLSNSMLINTIFNGHKGGGWFDTRGLRLRKVPVGDIETLTVDSIKPTIDRLLAEGPLPRHFESFQAHHALRDLTPTVYAFVAHGGAMGVLSIVPHDTEEQITVRCRFIQSQSAGVAAGSPHVIERELTAAYEKPTAYLDLDTGAYFAPEPAIGYSPARLVYQHDLDKVGEVDLFFENAYFTSIPPGEPKPVEEYRLVGLDLTLIPLLGQDIAAVRDEEVKQVISNRPNTDPPVEGRTIIPRTPATYAFQTREGSIGVLAIIKNERADRITIHCRLIGTEGELVPAKAVSDDAGDEPVDNRLYTRAELEQPEGEPASLERDLFELDLDGDGVDELFVDHPYTRSGMGSYYTIFEKSGDRYRYVAALVLHPGAFRVLPPTDEHPIRVARYLKASGSEGLLETLALLDGEFSVLLSETVHPGDGGTDEGRRRYAEMFTPNEDAQRP